MSWYIFCVDCLVVFESALDGEWIKWSFNIFQLDGISAVLYAAEAGYSRLFFTTKNPFFFWCNEKTNLWEKTTFFFFYFGLAL